jgi:ABC-type uncharacterized transport system permease subunit
MQILITLITFSLYLGASTLILMRLKALASGGRADKAPLLWAWGTALPLHAQVLYQHLATAGGLDLEFFNALSVVAILIAALLFLTALRNPSEYLGIIVLPTAALSLIPVQFVRPHQEVITEPQLTAHVVSSLLAYSILTLSAFQAVLLAIQDRHLHNHHPGGLIRALPPLRAMERLLFQLIGLGFILLSVSLITGFLFLDNIFAQHLVHKTVLSIAAWGVFGMLLWGRWRFGWRGRTAIHWTLAGFFVLMLAYFGTKLVLELVLQRA